MKKSLSHLPSYKQAALKRIVGYIREEVDPAMIILFGSHARGDWVEDRYTENGVIYEYISDYDILMIVEDYKMADHRARWDRLAERISRAGDLVNPICHSIHYVNHKLSEGQYFFTDIKKEGILLYDSKQFKLERARKLSPEERQQIAKEDYKYWLESANTFLHGFDLYLKKRRYKEAAFELHQATERFYTTILLVFTNYKPKFHNIEKLDKRAAAEHPGVLPIFPRATEEEKRLFELLKKAYVDARYKKSYKINKRELEYLAGRVRKLRTLTRKICREKIAGFTQET